MREIFGFDAFAPEHIAERVETVEVAKAGLPLLSKIVLGVLLRQDVERSCYCEIPMA